MKGEIEGEKDSKSRIADDNIGTSEDDRSGATKGLFVLRHSTHSRKLANVEI